MADDESGGEAEYEEAAEIEEEGGVLPMEDEEVGDTAAAAEEAEAEGLEGVAGAEELLAAPESGGAPVSVEAVPSAAGGAERPAAVKRTTKYLTKYERARLLGTRALQISQNAPIMVDLEGETDPLEIAKKELREKKIPMIVRRYLPDGSYEDWTMDELIVD